MANMKVFLHGWGMNSRVFDSYIETFLKDEHVISLDLPGYEPNSESLLSFDEQVLTLKSQIPQGAHLIAWSLGGLYALKLNSLFPKWLDKITLICSTPSFAQRKGFNHALNSEVLSQFGEQLSKNRDKTIERFLLLQLHGENNAIRIAKKLKSQISEYSKPSEEVLNFGLECLLNLDFRQELGDTRVPIQFILGENDKLVPISVRKDLISYSSQVSVEVIEKSGHLPFITHVNKFHRATK